MPTTFNVISVGVFGDIDTTEGNTTAEAAASLVGTTFGSAGSPLYDDFVSFTSAGTGSSGGVAGVYDMDTNADQFSVDGGAAQTFDGVAIYNATITYSDGTPPATMTLVLFQDINGNTYLAPELSAGVDQTVLEAAPIESITLDSLSGDTFSGLGDDRETWNFLTCFVRGTLIETTDGLAAVEDLQIGDMVRTKDHGFQPLRWTGHRTVMAKGAFAPILIKKGALGNTEDLRVSPQHRMLISGWRSEIHTGHAEVLVAAKHLVNGETILRESGGEVDYFHIMFDQHELVYAAGIESESFNPGQAGWNTLSQDTCDEILALFPELRENGLAAYGATARPSLKSFEAQLLLR